MADEAPIAGNARVNNVNVTGLVAKLPLVGETISIVLVFVR